MISVVNPFDTEADQVDPKVEADQADPEAEAADKAQPEEGETVHTARCAT